MRLKTILWRPYFGDYTVEPVSTPGTSMTAGAAERISPVSSRSPKRHIFPSDSHAMVSFICVLIGWCCRRKLYQERDNQVVLGSNMLRKARHVTWCGQHFVKVSTEICPLVCDLYTEYNLAARLQQSLHTLKIKVFTLWQWCPNPLL